jgi:hypothetical protein
MYHAAELVFGGGTLGDRAYLVPLVARHGPRPV